MVLMTAAGNALSGFSKLSLSAVAIWLLGAEAAGDLARDFAAGTTLGTFAAVGFAGAALHFVPRFRGSGGDGNIALAWAARGAFVGTGVVTVGALLAAVVILRGLTLQFVAVTAGYGLYLFGKHVPFVTGHPFRYLIIEVTTFLVILGSVVAGSVLQSPQSVLWFVAAGLVLPTFLAGGASLWRSVTLRDHPTGIATVRREFWRYAVLVLLATGVAYATNNIPISVLGLRGDVRVSEAAYFAALTAVVAPLFLLPRAIGINLVVDLSRDVGRGALPSASLVGTSTTVLGLTAFLAIGVISVGADILVRVTTATTDATLKMGLFWLTIGAILLVVVTPLANLLAATGRIGTNAVASCVQAVVTLPPMLVVLPTVEVFAVFVALGAMAKAGITIVATWNLAPVPARRALQFSVVLLLLSLPTAVLPGMAWWTQVGAFAVFVAGFVRTRALWRQMLVRPRRDPEGP